jgi:hypothetical protein
LPRWIRLWLRHLLRAPGANVPADEEGAVHKQMMLLPTRHLPTLMAGVALEVVVLQLVLVLPLAEGAVRVAEVLEVVDAEDAADGAAMLPHL